MQELRKTGLDNLLVEESMKNLRGDEVKLAKLPKHLLKEPRDADATSAKMIQQLKDVSSKLGSEVCGYLAGYFRGMFRGTSGCLETRLISKDAMHLLDEMSMRTVQFRCAVFTEVACGATAWGRGISHA